jgi:ethanolamine ammonia-lyase small subunit
MTRTPISSRVGADLRQLTPARVALGLTGAGLPTQAMLEFQAAHARARDAVHSQLDIAALVAALGGDDVIVVRSMARDRASYIRNPSQGRRLLEDDRKYLAAGRHDVALVIGDGLSAGAAQRYAPPVIAALKDRSRGELSFAPIVVACGARVALGDEIGELLGASVVAILLGERPGLTTANSLGIYVTWQPHVGRRDSERNCISNIHIRGLPTMDAASQLCGILQAARRHCVTGVALSALSHQSPRDPLKIISAS